ncbi:MAG: WD40/YVTN/BNR-like repeat-containing protein, partial [Candidatus Kapaibacterium sp.]
LGMTSGGGLGTAYGGIGYACGKQGAIWKTTDSGITWQKLNQTATQCDLYSISFLQGQWGVAVGFSNGPAIIYTTDGGNTWASAKVPAGVATIRDVIYRETPGAFCFAVGADSSGHGVILYSDYGGEYWIIDKTTPMPMYSITMDDEYLDGRNPMIAVGDAGQVFVTTAWKPDSNGAIYYGLIWNDHSSGNENLRSISYFTNTYDVFEGVALTDNGSTLWTTDGGVTWAEHSQNVSSYVPNSAVYAASGSEAWISGSHIGRTTDNGVTWKNEDPVSGQTWTCITGAGRIGFLSGAGLYWLIR